MALQLIESTKLDEMGFDGKVQIPGSMVTMSGKLKDELAAMRKASKDADGKKNPEHPKYKEADAIAAKHKISVIWDFSRLSFRNATKLLVASQSPTVGVQNALRAALTDEQLKVLATGEHPKDKDGKEVDLPGGCKVEKNKLRINLAVWMDRPNARANSKTPVEKMATQYEKLSDAEKEALRKLMGL